MPILKLRLRVPNIPFLFNPDLIGGGVLSVDTSFITIDSDIFRADNHYNLTRGPELVTNGSFSNGSANWQGDDATLDVSNNTGKVTVTSNTEAGIKTSGVSSFTQGKKYRLTFDVVSATGGLVSGTIKEYSSANVVGSWNGVGSYTIPFTYKSSSSQLRWLSSATPGDILEIDNVSVTEDKTFGPELVTNGGFDTDSDWDLGSSWTISGGKANYDATSTGAELKQLMSSIAVGKTIKIQFDISDVAATKDAFFKLDCSGVPESIFGYTKFSQGTYTYHHTITSGFDRLTFTALNSSTGGAFSIDNVSVKEDRSLNIL